MRRALLLTSLVIVVLAAYLWWQSAAADVTPSSSLVPLLGGQDTTGFARAMEPNNVAFPRDLGPHDAYQTEWWYYTGNLQTAEGRPFGFQLTFFRRALTPEEPGADEPSAAASAWRTNQVYLAHFTISDIEARNFYQNERFSRGAAGLAGARAEPYQIWLEDWSAREIGPGRVRLQAQGGQVALDIVLNQTLPPILHGDGGLSAKGPEPGNASHYYSIIQQEAEGTVTVGQSRYAVSGKAWKDHEYSTRALSDGAVGWDWYSLQLDNGAGLMFFEIRNRDGNLEPFSSGSFIAPDGTVTPLEVEDWQVDVLDTWTSPHSGADYPAAWRISVPKLDLLLEGRPLMADQELNVSTVYWEGAVAFTGTLDGRPISAQGYIELTGYAEEMTGRL
jgi:predicted secreted hydrolase